MEHEAVEMAHGNGVDATGDQLTNIIDAFIKGKRLEEVKLKEVRAHVEAVTGIKPEKEATVKVIQSLMVDEEEEEEEEDDEDEDEDELDEGDKKGGSRQCWLASPLANLLGVDEAARGEVTKYVLDYVKKNNLQDPNNGRVFHCDEALREVFKRDRVELSALPRLLSQHLKPKQPLMHIAGDAQENLLDEHGSGHHDGGVDEDDGHGTWDSDGEHRADGAKAKPRAKTAVKRKATKKKSKRSEARGGFGKEMLAISPVLEEFLGKNDLTRPQIVKAIWDYIKLHNLQNPANRREIKCDDELYKVFRRPLITMFSLNKYLTVHIKTKAQVQSGEPFHLDKLDLDDAAFDAQRGPESKSKKRKREAKLTADQPKKKRGGFKATLPISGELSAFMGGALEATRGEVVKHLWQHIRAHDLQNPENRQEIICDETLRSLLNQDKVTQFSINKHIQPHFLKREAEFKGHGGSEMDDDGSLAFQPPPPPLSDHV